MKTLQCLSDEELSAFDLGNLSGERYEEVSDHLEACESCARRFEALEQQSDPLVAVLRKELPPEVLQGDSELCRLIDAAAAAGMQNTRIVENTETSDGVSPRRPFTEQIVAMLLSPPEQPGELGRLGGYRVLKVLGLGGMGVVFQAEDPALQRPVALKAMLPHVAAGSPTARERFLREARATASFQHDHVVTIHQVGEDRGIPFIAMQLLSGESLAARLDRQQQLSIKEALHIGLETAEGLAAAHAKELLHRDIKPDNIWLESKDEDRRGEKDEGGRRKDEEESPSSSSFNPPSSFRVKLLDFGLARAANDQANLTQSGVAVGTPSYLAPEQAEGRPVDGRADLFSLGVVLYEMLTGKSPFRRETVVATILAIHSETPPAPATLAEQVPAALSDLVMRLLEKAPQKRPASAREVIRALRALDAAPSAPAPSPVVAPVPTSVAQPAGKKTLPPRRALIATAAAAVALLMVATVIIIIRNKGGEVVAKIEAPDGTTVETEAKPEGKPEPVRPAPAVDQNSSFLPPMSPIALVERPARLTAKDGGEAVESWTLATAQLPVDSFSICALRPDGKRLATFHEDGHVRIWDPELKRLEKLLVGHTGGAGGAAWSFLPNGNWYRTNARRFGPLAWHPQGAWLASVSRDGSLRVWDVASGLVAFQQSAVAGDLSMVAWSPDGAQLAAGCLVSQSVRIWNTADWKEQKLLDGLGVSPSDLLWSPDSSTLAVGAKSVVLYTPGTGDVRRVNGAVVADRLTGSPSVRWSPDGKYLAHKTATSVIISDAKTLNRVREIWKEGAAKASMRDFAWSPDGRQVLIGWKAANKASHTIHDMATGESSRTLGDALSSGIYGECLEWLPDGRTAAINGKLVDLETQVVLGLATVDKRESFRQFCEWSDDGRRAVLYKPSDARPYVIRLDTPNKPEELYSPSLMRPPTNSLAAWSPDGQHLYLGHLVKQVFSFDAGGAFARFVSPSRDFGSWNPSGTQTLSSVYASMTPAICQWPSGELVRELKLPFHLGSHAWSPDGSKIVIGQQGQEHAVRVLSTSSGETLSEWTVPSIGGNNMNVLDWHADRIAITVSGGKWVESASGKWIESAVHICSAADGATIYSLPPETKGHFVRWLPGGMQLLRYGMSDKASLYDAADGRLLREFPITVNAVHFVDKETVLCASSDGTVQRLNAGTGATEIISRFAGEAKLFSPDGTLLICDLANVRRLVRVADGQTALAIADSGLLVGPDGHLMANPLPKGVTWAASTGVKDSVVYIVQTASGQQTLTPAEFANKYGWLNDPSQVRLKDASR